MGGVIENKRSIAVHVRPPAGDSRAAGPVVSTVGKRLPSRHTANSRRKWAVRHIPRIELRHSGRQGGDKGYATDAVLRAPGVTRRADV